MFCPKCKCEYRAGFTMCSSCNISLVEKLPKDENNGKFENTERIENHDEIKKNIIGIALLYNIITGILSLPRRLDVFIIKGYYKTTIIFFLQRNALWIIVVIGVIIILSVYKNKLHQNFFIDILQNRNICIITGVLVIIEGLISFSSYLPYSIISIQTTLQLYHVLQQAGESVEITSIVKLIIPEVFISLQIFLGVYLVKFNKRKNN